MLDEIDKLGMDFRGDPASALLEVLDPEQNSSFRDHYVDVPFDLSRALFITTANLLDTVPPALRDRMEIIELPGYTEEEKVRIARQHLVPKQAEDHGLIEGEQISWTDAALTHLVRYYTREAGLRNLEREIAAITRKVAKRRVEGPTEPVEVTPELVGELLGAPRFLLEELEERTRVPGVAVGLAWTAAGGDILFIEATRMKGRQDAHAHRPARRRDEGVRAGRAVVGALARRRISASGPISGTRRTSTSTSRPAPSRRTARRPA